MQIKVSIIIPVYNVERYLEECLLSAVNQDYENIEIIIVDDGSTDGSDKIVEKFKVEYSIIKTIRTKNQGLSAARNQGLEMATGDYVVFLDSDDWFEKNTVSLCIQKVMENKLDIVLFSAKPFIDGKPDGKTDLDKIYIRQAALNHSVIESSNYFVEVLKLNNYIVQACMYMFNRVKFSNLRFYPGILHEDNLFTTQLLMEHVDAKLMCLPDTLFHRRFRPESIMTQNKQQRHIDGYFVVTDELIKLLPIHQGRQKAALKHFISKILFEILLILNPVYGWHIPLKIRVRILSMYLKYGLTPFDLKLFVKFMIPGSFSLWKSHRA